MKLFHSSASPFARKVRILAALRGLTDRIELVTANALESPPDLLAANPLSKIPALVRDDGSTLIDSPVICEYLDSLGATGAPLFPLSGEDRWTALYLQALADGIMDAAVAVIFESRRPQEDARATNIARQKAAIARSLDVLETEADTLEGPWTIGGVSVVAALGYLHFRLGADDWLDGRPKLAAWYGKASADPTVAESAPA